MLDREQRKPAWEDEGEDFIQRSGLQIEIVDIPLTVSFLSTFHDILGALD